MSEICILIPCFGALYLGYLECKKENYKCASLLCLGAPIAIPVIGVVAISLVVKESCGPKPQEMVEGQ